MDRVSESPGQSQRYCTNCGAQIRPGNSFCVSCGQRLPAGDHDHVGENTNPIKKFYEETQSRYRQWSEAQAAERQRNETLRATEQRHNEGDGWSPSTVRAGLWGLGALGVIIALLALIVLVSFPSYTQSKQDFKHWNRQARATYDPYYSYGSYETDYSDAALVLCRLDRYKGDQLDYLVNVDAYLIGQDAVAQNDYLNNVADDYNVPRYSESCDRSWERYMETP